jgi:hypothetical protein
LTHRGHRGYFAFVRKNGETNPVAILMIIAAAAGGFYAFHAFPLYWDNLDAKEAAAEAFNQYLIDGEKNAKAALLVRLNQKSPNTSHYETDEEGVEVEKPGFGLSEDHITFSLNEATSMLTIRIEYDRIVEFKPLKKRKTYHLVAEKIGTTKK